MGVRLGSVGVEGELPAQLYCIYNHQSLLPLLYELFESVGMVSMVADVSGFRGGIELACGKK